MKPFSTMNPVIPPRAPLDRSFAAYTTTTSAIGPLVTQIFVPFRIQQPFRRVALVWIDAASDPLDGSVSENAAIFRPAVRSGRYRRFWSSVPPR